MSKSKSVLQDSLNRINSQIQYQELDIAAAEACLIASRATLDAYKRDKLELEAGISLLEAVEVANSIQVKPTLILGKLSFLTADETSIKVYQI